MTASSRNLLEPLSGEVTWTFPAGELEQLASLRAWAEDPGHHFTLERVRTAAPGTPEERHRRVRVLEHRAGRAADELHVYGITFGISEAMGGDLYRHASVSTDRCQTEPNRAVVQVLLQALGYHGNFESWQVRRKAGELEHTYEIFEPFTVN